MTESTNNHDVQTIRMPVRHDLTNEEIAGEARKLAALTRVRERKESEFKCLQKQWKSDDQQLELQINAHRDRIEQGWDMRPADCVVYFNEPENGKKTIILASNGSVVSVEDMSPFDLDKELPLQMPAEAFAKDEGPIRNKPDVYCLPDDEVNTRGEINPNYDPQIGGRLATRVGDILDSTAAKTEQPLIILPGFESDDWKATALRAAAKKAMKAAGWDIVAVSTFMEQLKGDDVAAIKSTLAPHVKKAGVVELSHDELVSAFGTFDGKQFASVFGLLDPLPVNFTVEQDTMDQKRWTSYLSESAVFANWPDQARRQLDHAMDGATLDQLVALAERLSGKGAQS